MIYCINCNSNNLDKSIYFFTCKNCKFGFYNKEYSSNIIFYFIKNYLIWIDLENKTTSINTAGKIIFKINQIKKIDKSDINNLKVFL